MEELHEMTHENTLQIADQKDFISYCQDQKEFVIVVVIINNNHGIQIRNFCQLL